MPRRYYSRPGLEDRFWAKVDKTDSCWNWIASRTPAGYGQFRANGQMVGTHRFSYEMLVGPIPEGLVIDHLCRNRACCNPAHLEPVTYSENVRRGPAGFIFAQKQWAKTHCPQGHEYTPENTRLTTTRAGNNARHCRACERERKARIRRERREQREGTAA